MLWYRDNIFYLNEWIKDMTEGINDDVEQFEKKIGFENI